MTLELNRLGVFCSGAFWLRTFALTAFVAIFLGTRGENASGGDILFFTLFFVSYIFATMKNEPKSVDITWNSVRYRDRVQMSKHRHEDVLFTLSGVNSVEIRQNPMERIFGFSHMVIRCTLQLESASRDLPDRKKHVFYGITDVERFCDEIGDYFPEDIIHIKVFGIER